MIAAEIGEGAGGDVHAIQAKLIKPVAGRFQREMVDAVLLQLRQQAMDLDRIGRGVLQGEFALGRHDADGAEAGGR